MTNDLLPDAFLQQMKRLLSEEELQLFLQALDQKARVSIRLNPEKLKEVPYEAKPLPWCPWAFVLRERPVFTMDPFFHSGAYYVQEASSNFLWQVLHQIAIPASSLALDLCAAPGGKTTLISSFLGDEGLVVANEVIKGRSKILKENVIKWGAANVVLTQNDPSHFSDLAGAFDVVLVDAPCSGEGLFRKDPNAIREWSAENVMICQGRQQRILRQAAELPRPGGYLIYSTCTYNRQENEENVRYLVENFGYEKVSLSLPDQWNIIRSEVLVGKESYPSYRFYPHQVDGEGLFMTILRRPGSEDSAAQVRRSRDFNHPHLSRFSINKKQEAKFPSLSFPFDIKLYRYEHHIFALNAAWAPVFEMLASKLNVQYFGVELGDWVKEKFLPAHAWALSMYPISAYPSVEISEEDAIMYLKKEPITLSIRDKGWVLVKHKGLNLGWVKNLGMRSNNYYPKEWRIRMQ
ncbi:methyltransferase RsmF C-terminal domain-like protein [Cyclobacterium lianum]|nr:hypothetical protein [Cyclobacterium lianum]